MTQGERGDLQGADADQTDSEFETFLSGQKVSDDILLHARRAYYGQSFSRLFPDVPQVPYKPLERRGLWREQVPLSVRQAASAILDDFCRKFPGRMAIYR